MESIIQQVLIGMSLGLGYVLITLGLALTLSIMRVVNVAHADMFMLGGFITYYLYGRFHINYFLVLLIAIVILGAVGAIMERTFFRPLRGKGFATSMVLSIGLLYFIEQSALLTFGEKHKGVPSIIPGVISVGGVTFGAERFLVMVISMFLVGALFLFLRRVKWGQAVRALSQDADAAYLQGIDINRVSMLCFAIGVALAGAAGVLMVPLGSVNYAIGSTLIIKSFMILVIGGLGNVLGCLIGGLLLGFIEAFSFAYIPGTQVNLVMFSLVMIVLLVRPQGLMGRTELD